MNWRETNNLAFANLDGWVQALNLPRLKRSGSGFAAVAGELLELHQRKAGAVRSFNREFTIENS